MTVVGICVGVKVILSKRSHWSIQDLMPNKERTTIAVLNLVKGTNLQEPLI